MSLLINKAVVRRSLEQWFIAAREGKTLGARETAELSAHDAAAASSDYFYDLLCYDEGTQPVVETAEAAGLIAGEDIAAGEYLFINDEGRVMVVPPEALQGDFFGG